MTAALPIFNNFKPNSEWAKLPIFDRREWKRVLFGDVVENLNENERNPTEAGIERFIGLEHLEPGSLHIHTWGNVANETTFTRRCRTGQVLFGKRRAYQRKVAVAEFDAVVSGDIYVLAPKNDWLLAGLLPFLCMSERFFQHAVGTSAGSISPRTNWGSLASFEFDLPPLDQQRRIAEILWTVDESQQTVDIVRARIDECIKSELSAVFLNEDGNTPLLRIEEVAAKQKNAIVDGPFGSNLKLIHYRNSGIPVIQSNFVTSGRFKADKYVYVTPEHFESEKRSRAESGDIIMAKIGENCGTCAILPEKHAVSIIAGNVLKVTTDQKLCLNRFLLYFFKFEYARNRLINVKNTTAQPAISMAQLKRLKFRVPSMKRQEELVERISNLEDVRAKVVQSLQSTSLLRTSLINGVII